MGLSAEVLQLRDDEVLVLLHGNDETFATRVSSRRSYRSNEIVCESCGTMIFLMG